MAVTNVAELNALVERVKKPSVNMPTFLNNRSTPSSVPPPSPPQTPESRLPRWPLPNPVWASSKTK